MEVSGQYHTSVALLPVNNPCVRWAPARLNEDKNSLILPGFEIQTAQLVASRCTDRTVLEP